MSKVKLLFTIVALDFFIFSVQAISGLIRQRVWGWWFNLYLGPGRVAGHTQVDGGGAAGDNCHPYFYTPEMAMAADKVAICFKTMLRLEVSLLV